MIRRYDMRRSDNYHVTGKVSYLATGSGTLNIITGFPVQSAIVTFSTLPLAPIGTSSSSSSEESSFVSLGNPRIYVSANLVNGFEVTFENIPTELGFFEFVYRAQ